MAKNPHSLATPKQVAAQLSISPSTLRAWSTQFASQLSMTANPPKEASGRVGRRLYNSQDVAILARARDLLASGLTYSRAVDVLRTEPQPPAVQDQPRDLATSDLARALLTIADQRQRLDDLEARLDALEGGRRPWWRRWF